MKKRIFKTNVFGFNFTTINLKKINIKRMVSEIPTNLLIIIAFHFTDIKIEFNLNKYCRNI